MAISRLAISNPGATTDTLLHTATRSSLASIIATNKANTVAEVRVWIVPQGQDATPANWSYIAYDADITATNSLETFRFPVIAGDKIYVRSTTADVSFQIMGIYETGADTYVYAQPTEPTAPQVGDIWVDTASDIPSIDNTTVYRWSKTAVGGETSLTGAGNDLSILQYIAGYEQVYLNGVLLAKDLDYFATNGTSITGLTALSSGDIVEVISPYAIELTDVYTKSVSDSKYDTKASSGLNLVIPTGVVVGSGTGTVSASGKISFSGASSIRIDNCFTNAYDNYKIIFRLSGISATNQPIRMQFVDGTTPAASTLYYFAANGLFFSGSASQTFGAAATSAIICYASSVAPDLTHFSMDVITPNNPLRTNWNWQAYSYDGTGSFGYSGAGSYDTSTQFEGINFFPGSGNISGTIRIYGYNNGGA
jgi:hypothetical protein